jgi:NAD(P)-dependent dehydrogenase (short-subunit alcohol dehydrogenase family)
MLKLNEKIAIVTGGSSGIGLATAKLFVEQGAYVFIAGRRQSELDKAKAEIGRNVTTVQADMSKLDDIDRLYATIKEEKGALDIIVVSAGVSEHMPTAEATPEHFDKVFNLNARGAYFTVQRALPILRGKGAIVLVASGVHHKGIHAHSAYSGSKAALRSFARTWAMEFKDRGIRVNTLSPGATETPMLNGQFESKEETEAMKKFIVSMTPLGRVGSAEEMAKAVLFLASDDSSFSTGIDLAADGGITQV